MKYRKSRTFMCDFETTVFKGQTYTEVWASACVELYTEDVQIFHSIDETYEYIKSLNTNICMYYHNLKFDGSFWLSFLLEKLKMKQAFVSTSDTTVDGYWMKTKDMPNNTFKYTISDKGQWYAIIIKVNNKVIEIRDSLKLLPFSVARIGKSFKTKHQKLDMEYEGYRYAGCEITDEEKEYISNDVLVMKEALEIMFNEGHNKMTIGACCLSEYKYITGPDDWKIFFPSLTDFPLDPVIHKYENADKWIRKSYKGGWCYLAKGKENKVYKNGITADVNSLYSSMMSSESGNRYPVGKPTFWKGNFIPVKAQEDNRYYFVHIKTRFYLKEGMLPFIQIKDNIMYNGREALETSDVYDKKTDNYYPRYFLDGVLHEAIVELTLTQTDFELMKEHYELVDFEIIDGCYFWSEIGLFDFYINKYRKIKMESTGALRELAKLFLNNLYGKMASSTDSSFKKAYVKDNGVIGFYSIYANDKEGGYIAVGSAITSYARNFTIRTAQKNYHGKDKPGFIYADTDSIHCDLKAEELQGLKVDNNAFCCWKLEATWDKAIFTRQKTYIEHVIEENLEPIDEPYYNVKCAGMPQRCKDLFVMSLTGDVPEDAKLNDEEQQFVDQKRELTDYKVGLTVPSKLMPKRILGGILLVPTTYEMR